MGYVACAINACLNTNGGIYMPAKSTKQQRFMGAELSRKREGEKTQTGMSEQQLKDFATKPKKKWAPGKKK